MQKISSIVFMFITILYCIKQAKCIPVRTSIRSLVCEVTTYILRKMKRERTIIYKCQSIFTLLWTKKRFLCKKNLGISPYTCCEYYLCICFTHSFHCARLFSYIVCCVHIPHTMQMHLEAEIVWQLPGKPLHTGICLFMYILLLYHAARLWK